MILAASGTPQVVAAEDFAGINFIAGTANTNLLIHYHN